MSLSVTNVATEYAAWTASPTTTYIAAVATAVQGQGRRYVDTPFPIIGEFITLDGGQTYQITFSGTSGNQSYDVQCNAGDYLVIASTSTG